MEILKKFLSNSTLRSAFCNVIIISATVVHFVSVDSSFAADAGNSIDTIINKQTKQIKNLNSRVETLENTLFDLRNELSELKSTKVNNGVNTSNADQSNNGVNAPNNAPLPLIASDLGNEQDAKNDQEKQVDFVPKQNIVVPKDKQEYDLALASLKAGNFAEAEIKFADFISNHPQSSLQANANFWYAESMYRQEMYNKAAIQYLQCYKKYPKEAKTADALFKLSQTLHLLNKDKEACSMLDKLEKEFPKRSADSIKRAKEARKQFHCK